MPIKNSEPYIIRSLTSPSIAGRSDDGNLRDEKGHTIGIDPRRRQHFIAPDSLRRGADHSEEARTWSSYYHREVGEHSRQEVARKAGVDPEYVDRLVELGILKPEPGDAFSTGDARKARWVRSLEVAGVPLDGMAAAVRDGTLSFSYLDASAFDRFAGLSSTTFERLSEETGIPLDLLKVMREAVGFAEPRPEDLVREDELSVVPAIELQLSLGFRPVVIERWLRVCADGLRRIAETEADWWRTEVEVPLIQAGMAEERCWMPRPISDPRSLPSPSRPSSPCTTRSRNTPGARAPSRTSRAHSSGPASQSVASSAGDLLPRHQRIHAPDRRARRRGRSRPGRAGGRARPAVLAGARWAAGEVARRRRDVLFPGPGRGRTGCPRDGRWRRRHALPPARVGIQAGPVVFQEGDYFGRTVNIAARIAEYARPVEVLVTKEVVDAADGRSVTFTEIGPSS